MPTPGVSPRWSNTLSGGRPDDPLLQSPRDTHSLLTKHQYREESGGGEEEEKKKQTFLCDEVAKVVSPMQESHHLTQMS